MPDRWTWVRSRRGPSLSSCRTTPGSSVPFAKKSRRPERLHRVCRDMALRWARHSRTACDRFDLAEQVDTRLYVSFPVTRVHFASGVIPVSLQSRGSGEAWSGPAAQVPTGICIPADIRRSGKQWPNGAVGGIALTCGTNRFRLRLHRRSEADISTRTAFKLVSSMALMVATLAACGDDPGPLRTVPVEIELQTINADATSYGYGINGGQGTSGYGAVNETMRETFYVTVGNPVFCKAFGTHWDSNDPGHQLICRILVDNEEIYMCADQGSPGSDTAIECGGPVYIPQEEDR